jgi:hypothetical protein
VAVVVRKEIGFPLVALRSLHRLMLALPNLVRLLTVDIILIHMALDSIRVVI